MRSHITSAFVALNGWAALAAVGPSVAIETLGDVTIARRKDASELHALVRFPKEGGPFPVVIFSHGIEANQRLAPELSRYWAGHGYVVIHPTHIEAALLAKDSPHARNPQIWFNRLRDMGELLDALAKPEAIDARLRGKLDASRIGMSGHSLGGHTSVLLAGATLHHDGKEERFRDHRVRAAMVVFPVEPNRYGLKPNSWQTITVPLMIMSGSGAWHNWGFEHSAAGQKYHLAVVGVSYFSFVNGKSSSSSPGIIATSQYASLRFWDAYLKNDEAAIKELQTRDLAIEGGASAILSHK